MSFVRTKEESLLLDLDTYRRGTPLYIEANEKYKALVKARREAKARKSAPRTYNPRDRVDYKKFYGLTKDEIRIKLDLNSSGSVLDWHRKKILKHRLGMAGVVRKRKLRQLGARK